MYFAGRNLPRRAGSSGEVVSVGSEGWERWGCVTEEGFDKVTRTSGEAQSAGRPGEQEGVRVRGRRKEGEGRRAEYGGRRRRRPVCGMRREQNCHQSTALLRGKNVVRLVQCGVLAGLRRGTGCE